MIAELMIAVLVIMSVVDVVWKKFPAGFVTGLVMFSFITCYVVGKEDFLFFGVAAYLFGRMLYEFGVPVKGMADVKVITMIGVMVVSVKYFLIFISLVLFLGFVYNVILLLIFKDETENVDEFPFIPILLFVYVALLLIGGVIA